VWHNGFPLAPASRIFLDLAAEHPLRTVRRALAKADYAGILDVRAIEAELAPGQRGAAALRRALIEHQPRLALTKSGLEVLFLEICEKAQMPLPEVNVRVAGWEVDALWGDRRIAVELDGYRNHRSPAQVKRDRRKELALRAAGYLPVRYSEEQLARHGNEVIADLRRLRGA
jgi:hypothetical protein